MSDELRELVIKLENLKCELWSYMDRTRKHHEGVRNTMNELLDIVEEIDEFGASTR